jgi:hypothetical protein
MAVRKVTQSAANVAKGGALYTMAELINDLQAQINRVRGSNLITTPALAIGSTKTAVATGAFTFRINGFGYLKTAVAAGTAPGNDVIPQGLYGAVALDISTDGTLDAIEAAANATGYATAALAIAGIPAPAALHIRVGTVTATKSDGAFTFGTTDLDAANSTVVYTNGVFDAEVDTLSFAETGAP